MSALLLWWLLAIRSFFFPFQQYSFGEANTALTFISPGEIQERLIPTTIDAIHSYYTSDERSLEWNRNWHKQMTASGSKCEIYEEPSREEAWLWKRTFSYVDCIQVPLSLKEYYLPSRNLRIKEPAIEDRWSGQHDPKRKWSLIASGNFLYSRIYDANHPEKQEISDHTSKAFAFFFMVRYRETPPYQQIEEFIREWSKLAYPQEATSQVISKESEESEGRKDFAVYTPYKRQKKNTKQELRKVFQYSVWCSAEKKQCLVYVNQKRLPVTWGIRTDYFGEINPFDKY